MLIENLNLKRIVSVYLVCILSVFCIAYTVAVRPLVWVVAALNILLGFQQPFDFRLIGNERSCNPFF